MKRAVQRRTRRIKERTKPGGEKEKGGTTIVVTFPRLDLELSRKSPGWGKEVKGRNPADAFRKRDRGERRKRGFDFTVIRLPCREREGKEIILKSASRSLEPRPS